MSKTRAGAATQATNSANDAITQSKQDYDAFLPGLRDQGQTFANRASENYDWANAGFKDFAETGGFSDAARNSFLNRATSGVRNTFDVLKKQAELSSRRTGGGSTPAALAQIARQGGQAQAQATDEANVSLNNMISQNRLAGIGGLANMYGTNAGMQSTLNQEYLAGLGSKWSNVSDFIAAKTKAAEFYNQSIADSITPWAQLGGQVLGAIPGL